MGDMNYREEYGYFRKEILLRDKYKCVLCGQPDSEENAKEEERKFGLVVHHLKCIDLFPELLMDRSNVITLCLSCHKKQHVTQQSILFVKTICFTPEMADCVKIISVHHSLKTPEDSVAVALKEAFHHPTPCLSIPLSKKSGFEQFELKYRSRYWLTRLAGSSFC